MAFASSKQAHALGTLLVEVHAFNAASVTTGVISAGFSHVLAAFIDNQVSGVVAGQKVAISGQNVTLSGVNSNDTGNIIVIGY